MFSKFQSYLRAPKGISSIRLVPRLSSLSIGSESIMKLNHVDRLDQSEIRI
jgi:hypothetical protein